MLTGDTVTRNVPNGGRCPSMAEKEWLSVEDLAAMFEVPVRSVYTWNQTGRGPAVTHVGRFVRYRREAVEEWAASRTEPVAS
jgi:predicted DNA-binding transcriptional regulator AlpA